MLPIFADEASDAGAHGGIPPPRLGRREVSVLRVDVGAHAGIPPSRLGRRDVDGADSVRTAACSWFCTGAHGGRPPVKLGRRSPEASPDLSVSGGSFGAQVGAPPDRLGRRADVGQNMASFDPDGS